jgi:hypothetical protein
LEHFADPVNLVHEPHAGTIVLLIVVAFFGSLPKDLTTIATVNVDNHSHCVFGPPNAIDLEPLAVGTQVDSSIRALPAHEFFNLSNIYL